MSRLYAGMHVCKYSAVFVCMRVCMHVCMYVCMYGQSVCMYSPKQERRRGEDIRRALGGL
jgi:hypothetical protein